MKIYIVKGSTGEYSDNQEWLVAWYKEERLARKHCELADKEAKVIYIDCESKLISYWNIPSGSNKYDPNMMTNYTGTNYSVEEVEEGTLMEIEVI